MKNDTERDYVLGTNEEEIARLGLQHRVWRPTVLDGWNRAGIRTGHRVLDVGAGPGFATMDLAEFVGPTGEVVAVEQVPITFEVEGVKGSLKVGGAIDAGLEPFKGATGKETAIHDTIFTTIPGSPAYVGKASHYKVDAPAFNINLQGYNAVSGSFRFEA